MAKAGHFSVSDGWIIEFCLNEYEGMQFLPSDDLIFRFLRTKNRDPNDSSVQFIKEIDLLNHEPWELPRLSLLGHYFCKPERYGNGKCRKRSTESGSGYWEQGGAAKTINDFGVRRTLTFYEHKKEKKKKEKEKKGKGKWTSYMIYEYEPTDFDFEENPFVMIRLERNLGHKCTSKYEAGSGERLASNAVDSLPENTPPQLPNAPEGEFSTVGGQADLHQSASDFGSHDSLIEVMKNLPPIISDFDTEVDDAIGPQVDPWPLVNSEIQAGGGANSIAPLSDINSCVSIGGIDAILTGNTNTIDSCVSIGGIDAILTVPLPPHVSVPVVQESSVDNHTSLSDQVYLSQHSTSIFDTEVRDAFGPQVDPRLVVESETEAGGGALSRTIDQVYTGNSYTNDEYEWANGLINFEEY